MTTNTYAGVEHDAQGGLTHLGRIIRDAGVFGLLPENENCAGWDSARIQNLYEKVYAAWGPYAHLPSKLPADLQERHNRIYTQAIALAHSQGWNAELGDDD